MFAVSIQQYITWLLPSAMTSDSAKLWHTFQTAPTSMFEIQYLFLILLLREINWKHRESSLSATFKSMFTVPHKMCCRIRNISEKDNLSKEHFGIISIQATGKQAVPSQDLGRMWQRSINVCITDSIWKLICLLFLQIDWTSYIILRP